MPIATGARYLSIVVVIDSSVSYVHDGIGVASPQPNMPSSAVTFTSTRIDGSPLRATLPPLTAKSAIVGSATGNVSTFAIFRSIGWIRLSETDGVMVAHPSTSSG